MDCNKQRRWHIVIDGDNCPKTDDVVVGVWVSVSETWGELCYYVKETKEWISANPNTRGDALIAPDYWIEFPDGDNDVMFSDEGLDGK